MSCSKDVSDAVADIAAASLTVFKAARNCKKGKEKCGDLVQHLIDKINDAAQHTEQAARDCDTSGPCK